MNSGRRRRKRREPRRAKMGDAYLTTSALPSNKVISRSRSMTACRKGGARDPCSKSKRGVSAWRDLGRGEWK